MAKSKRNPKKKQPTKKGTEGIKPNADTSAPAEPVELFRAVLTGDNVTTHLGENIPLLTLFTAIGLTTGHVIGQAYVKDPKLAKDPTGFVAAIRQIEQVALKQIRRMQGRNDPGDGSGPLRPDTEPLDVTPDVEVGSDDLLSSIE